MNEYKSINWWVISFTALFTLILFVNLFMPPLGMKTSTDFGRIMDLFNLYYQPGEMNWGSFHGVFNTNRPENFATYNGYMATTSIFLFISFIPNYLVRLFTENSSDLYYIVCLGLMYVVAYIYAFYILMLYSYEKISNKIMFTIFGILAIWSLNDILFTEYFNTFFQEPAFIVTLLLFTVCFLRYKNFFLDIVLFTLIIFSKEQNLTFLLLLIPIYFKHKINIGRIAVTILLIGSVVYIYNNINSYLKVMNTEDGVLSGLLHNSSENEAKEILTKIGLDSNLYVLANRDYWGNIGHIRENPNDINLQQQFQNAATQISKKHTILGYIYFPQKFMYNYSEYLKITDTSGPFVDNYSFNDNGVLLAEHSSYYSKIVLKNLKYLLLFNLIIVIALIIGYCYCKIKQLKTISSSNYSNNYIFLFILNIYYVNNYSDKFYGCRLRRGGKALFGVIFY